MQRNRQKKARQVAVFGILLVVAIIIVGSFFGNVYKKVFYPIKFEEYVTKYAEKYDIDKYFLYAVIKTESGFDSEAESNVGASGLMQLMPDAFDWVKYRMGDERELTFDDMKNPEYNIEYGGYMLKLLTDEYQDLPTAVAAYHAGRQSVNDWLSDKTCSDDGVRLQNIPSKTTAHYVDKVITKYEGYTKIYNK